LTLALLLGVISAHPPSSSSGSSVPAGLSPSPLVASLGALALFVVCWLTFYRPVLEAKGLESEGDLAGAAAADPLDANVCRELAQAELRKLLEGRREALTDLDSALESAQAKNPRWYVVHQLAGDADLTVYRMFNRPQRLKSAAEHYSTAISRYPNYSFLHAQLAWCCHVAGDDERARAAAREALRLDALCPHADKQLKAQRLDDPGMPARERNLALNDLMRRLAESSDVVHPAPGSAEQQPGRRGQQQEEHPGDG
jgi:tetratricopeptide (TPR) repeat protein